MSFFDILHLALRNLREAKLRAALTTMGVIVGVAVIVTMVSFGLGLQRNTVARFNELDLFNEITVYGRSLSSLVAIGLGNGRAAEAAKGASERGRRKSSARTLDDAALAEIAKIPGVAYVEPSINFTAYVRANGRVQQQTIGGVRVPNAASRFKGYAAGDMISVPEADDAIVDESFLSSFGYQKASDAIGQRIDFLAPPTPQGAGGGTTTARDGTAGKSRRDGDTAPRDESVGSVDAEDAAAEKGAPLSFFGLPLEDLAGAEGEGGTSENGSAERGLVARSFRIVGVLKDELEKGSGSRTRFRGLMPVANIYIPLMAAQAWETTHRGMLDEVALRLARETGALGADETEGYNSATVRLSDPLVVQDVVNTLTDAGFSTFGLFTQLEQLRTLFLIINSALGLLGGISLLVASFGIANTMIMSIFERTREIGIMKAIGAEDREIKLIFFVEAAVIGLAGGIAGSLAAWGIDKLANRLAYQFLLQPKGAPFIDFFSLPPYLWLGAIAFATVVSILAALYPATRAARIDPVTALRHD